MNQETYVYQESTSESDFDEDENEIIANRSQFESIDELLPVPRRGSRHIWCRRIFSQPFWPEIKVMYRLAAAVFLTSIGQSALLIESNIFSGSLGTDVLATVGLSNSIIYALGIVVGTGLVTSCDTLFSQLYGSSNRHRMGMILQKSVLIISMVPLICSVYLFNLEPLLLLIGQDPLVAKQSAEYTLWFFPGLFFAFNALIMARYLQSQDKAMIPLIAVLFSNIVNLILQYVFVVHLKFGYRASAVSLAVSFATQWLLELIYAACIRRNEETWRGLRKEALMEWGSFTKLAISGVCHIFLEILSWEVGVLIAGSFGATHLGAMTIAYNIESLIYSVPFGFGVALSIRIGQSLGGGRREAAKHALKVALVNYVFISIILILICSLSMTPVARVYTTDIETLALFERIKPYLIACIALDGYTALFGGVLRGCGLQFRGALIVIICYYGLCTPLYFILGFIYRMKVVGLWLALTITLIFLSLAYAIVLMCLDWDRQATRVQNAMMTTLESMIFERTLGRTSECTPLIGRWRNSHQPKNIAAIPEDDHVPTTQSIEPWNTVSIYSYTTSTHVLARSAFMPILGPIPMETHIMSRVPRRKFKRKLALRIVILCICLLIFVSSILTRIFLKPFLCDWFPNRNTTFH